MVMTYETKVQGKTSFERLQAKKGYGIHHGPIWQDNILLQTDS
jgi:hypothetical protein